MRGAVSKGGGNASLADEILVGGQGVRSDPESEGFEEKYRAVIDRGRPLMNRSAKDGIRSSPHYGGEGVTHSPIAPRCLVPSRFVLEFDWRSLRLDEDTWSGRKVNRLIGEFLRQALPSIDFAQGDLT